MQIDRSVTEFITDILKSVGIAILFCLVGVLLFALVIKLASLPTEVISPVNQVLKTLGILLGCVLGFRPTQGILKGITCGVLSIVATYLIFSFLSGGVSLSWTILLELLFGGVVGAVSGVLSVNLRK